LLSAGFIPLYWCYLNENDGLPLECRYHVTKRTTVAKALEIAPEHMQLLATFSGNDYVSEAMLLKWHESIGMVEPLTHREVFPLVAAQITACAGSAEKLLEAVSATQKNAEPLQQAAKYSLDEYQSVEAKDEYGASVETTTLTLDGKTWPKYLIMKHRQGELGHISGAACRNMWWCMPTTERIRSTSVYNASQSIRSSIFSILHPEGGEMSEYRRPDGQAGFRSHKIEARAAAAAELPSVDSVPGMSSEARMAVIFKLLEVDESILKLPEHLQLGVAALCYLLKRPVAKGQFSLDLKSMCNMIALMQEEQEPIEGNVRRPDWWRDTDTDIAIALSEWHAMLDVADGLNAVLDSPLAAIKPQLLFGGLAGHVCYKKGDKFLKKVGPEAKALRDQLLEITGSMVATISNAMDVNKYIPGKWKGRLLYDGDWDENYSLTVSTVLDKESHSATGQHVAFDGEGDCKVKVYYQEDGTTRLTIDDGDSIMIGEIDEDGKITGKAYEINEKGKKKSVGEFELNFKEALARPAAPEPVAEEEAPEEAAPAEEEEIEVIDTFGQDLPGKKVKDKYAEELREPLRKLNNFIRISDWVAVKDSITELIPRVKIAIKVHTKSKDDTAKQQVLRLWGKILSYIEEEAEAKWAEKKKLDKDKQRILANVRKTVTEMVSGEHKDAVEIFKANPESEAESGEEEEDEE